MALINLPYTFSVGQTIIASQHNSNFSTIYNDYNGNITDSNIASGAQIAYSKLSLNASIKNSDLLSGVGTSVGNIIQLVSGTTAQLPAVGGSLLTGVVPSANLNNNGHQLGAWDATKVVSTVYQASTDGFVLVFGDVQGNSQKGWGIFTDSSNPPTTQRTSNTSSSATTETVESAMCPVRKGDYWEIIYTFGSPSLTIFWIPMGS